MFYLFQAMFLIVAMILDNVLGIAFELIGYGPIYFIVAFALLIPALAAGVRRMHDTNHSGWFLLLPFYNLYLLVKNGDVGSNQYGEDPKNPGLQIEDNLIQRHDN